MSNEDQNAVGTGPDPGVVCAPETWADALHVFLNGRAANPEDWQTAMEQSLVELRKYAGTPEQLFFVHAMLRYVQADIAGRRGLFRVPTQAMLANSGYVYKTGTDATIVEHEFACS